ncbi:hypothetical protein RRG08_024618 [Elysia crispata]|uniref:Uncharacterized protein n=1 Tax=Elysia crispata TaxID=231223 RepID=A0AAE0ZWA4_9GAST|nr:hypothetical protein RRG08_024618 [Elysia crispata]
MRSDLHGSFSSLTCVPKLNTLRSEVGIRFIDQNESESSYSNETIIFVRRLYSVYEATAKLTLPTQEQPAKRSTMTVSLAKSAIEKLIASVLERRKIHDLDLRANVTGVKSVEQRGFCQSAHHVTLQDQPADVRLSSLVTLHHGQSVLQS